MKTRYEYEFVTVEPGRHGERDAYRAVIDERAALGWRLVQILPVTGRRARGAVDIVFERPAGPAADEADVTVVPI